MFTYLRIKETINKTYDIEEFLANIIMIPFILFVDIVFIIFQPIFENNKLSAKSFFNEIRDKASLIYLFDCDDIKLNDKEDIDEIIDILKNRPRDFYG